MFSLLRRSRQNPRRVSIRESSLSPGHSHRSRQDSKPRHATADFTEPDDDEDETNDEGLDRFPSQVDTRVADDNEDDDMSQDGDGPRNQGRRRGGLPVLPLFSSEHLGKFFVLDFNNRFPLSCCRTLQLTFIVDALPVYNITHAIRIIVSTRTETTLTWEQLRSPQISQFLIKPMQQQVRTQHFSRATLYALMANCLQFNKEGQLYPANAGTSNTRAKVCELLALKLLKEYSTRELIDALAYDFYPLQGLPGAPRPNPTSAKANMSLMASRTSTLEVAIRASAKHFLAHPVVIQQLEAIWKGAITFYSSADSLHRTPPTSRDGSPSKADSRTPLLGSLPTRNSQGGGLDGRRSVTLYDPRQASLFKLSRLRVPKYRSFLSTISLAVLIGLFLAVLSRRSAKITGLELIFWFWSAGFMLDELVGFNEQGFALYIMSFWNIFDLGILVLLIMYYCMRVYGVFLADPHHWNNMAYDVLAANAILLLPRIFSVLDHYQYFSQLLIAFRLMAVDLAAVFVLVLIACSGFFVFFTVANNPNSAAEIAYKIFQILMGFSPAAWELWHDSNYMGRILLVLFLIICHFLVVTILITVLTNSFMAIASNATEEHQFLFAINTIAMVKDNAMFSYIAPSNIFAWLLMPLRFCMPLKQFVWLNRTIIKVTHLPILFCIYLYERMWLAPSMYEPTDLVEGDNTGRERSLSYLDPTNRSAIFSPNIRGREESVAGFQKDRALEEVFRRVPIDPTLRTKRRNQRRKQQRDIRTWMEQHEDEAAESVNNWPTVNSRPAAPEWQRRLSVGWAPSHLRHVSDIRSVASDPADLISNLGSNAPFRVTMVQVPSVQEAKEQTDADGDDELVTNDEDEDDHGTNAERSPYAKIMEHEVQDSYFNTPLVAQYTQLPSSHSSSGKGRLQTPKQTIRRSAHNRTLSTGTILFNPQETKNLVKPASVSPPRGSPVNKRSSGRNTGSNTPAKRPSRRSSPKRAAHTATTKPRPILAPRGMTETAGLARPALINSSSLGSRMRTNRRLSSLDLPMMSDHLPSEDLNAGLAGSFQTQMAMALMKDARFHTTEGPDSADRDRMSRLVLARMKTLEESFGEVIKEMRDLKTSSTAAGTRWNSSNEDEDRIGAGLSTDLVAGMRHKRRKGDVTPKRASMLGRPGSKHGPGNMKSGTSSPRIGKGKSRAVSSDDEADEEEAGFSHRGASF